MPPRKNSTPDSLRAHEAGMQWRLSDDREADRRDGSDRSKDMNMRVRCTDASNAELYVTVAQSGSPSHLTTERSIIVTKAPETSPDIGP